MHVVVALICPVFSFRRDAVPTARTCTAPLFLLVATRLVVWCYSAAWTRLVCHPRVSTFPPCPSPTMASRVLLRCALALLMLLAAMAAAAGAQGQPLFSRPAARSPPPLQARVAMCRC